MSWLARLRARASVGPMLQQRLHVLSERPPPAIRRAHRMTRYVAVDVETSGLDMRRDHVISIGAVALTGGVLNLADSFEVVLQQTEVSSEANILVHQIGGDRQRAGIDPQEALLRFLEFAGQAPLVAFRADFDREMLERALEAHLGVAPGNLWLDLAKLLPALLPGNECRTMDDWLALLNIRLVARHDALADAFATAQMLQVTLAAADRVGMDCAARLDEMQRAHRWLGTR
jgi:DNA polymerase III subunit epsilon